MELLERDAALRALAEGLREAAGGDGRIALVSGEAGIGKTALMEGFLAPHRAEARTLVGRCDALFTPQPLGPLHDVALQTGGALLELIESTAGRLAIFGAALRELQSGEKPTVLVFEDIHWADAATLDLLKYLGRRICSTATLIVLTYRDDELDASHPLWSVLGDLPSGAVRRVPLAPLSEAAVTRLARRAGRPADGMHAQTGGNPFCVTELLASPPGSIPVTVRDATLARALRLSPQARAVLELCAVVPNRVERWLLDDPAAPTANLIDDCVASGLILPQGDVMMFRHELAREAVESVLPPSRSRSLHADVLRRLLARGGSVPIARLVHHATLAGDVATVHRFAPEAARQASALGAHREAAAHYRTALEHAPTHDLEARATLLEGRAYECHLIDQVDDAVAAQETALDLRRQQGNLLKVGDNLRWLSRLAWIRGCGHEARQLALEAVQVLEQLPPGAELAMVYSTMSQLHMLAEDGPAALEWGQRALRIAEPLGLTETVVHALNNVGTAELLMGDLAGREKLERSLELALAHGMHEHAARAYVNLTNVALIARDYDRARQLIADGIAHMSNCDLDSWTMHPLSERSRVHLEQGLWREAEDDASAVVRAAPMAITWLVAAVVLGSVRTRRGESGAEPLLDEARRRAWAAGEIQYIGPVAAARAEAAWLEGDNGRARDEVAAAYELALRHPEPWRLGELGLWLWRAGALDRPSEGMALPYRLEIGGDWQDAAAAWRQIGCPYEEALALITGDRAAQLRALEILTGLGAAPAAAMVRRLLRAEGARGIPRGPRAATRHNPVGLTTRQIAILALLTEDLSNKEIAARLRIAPKTVDHHVCAILAKLEVSTRKQAARHPVARNLLIEPREPETAHESQFSKLWEDGGEVAVGTRGNR